MYFQTFKRRKYVEYGRQPKELKVATQKPLFFRTGKLANVIKTKVRYCVTIKQDCGSET